jgi:hypothetical protein
MNGLSTTQRGQRGLMNRRNGFYTHRGLDGQASSIRPGVITPDPPPRSRPQEHGWTRGSAEEIDKVSLRTCYLDLLFAWIRGSMLICAWSLEQSLLSAALKEGVAAESNGRRSNICIHSPASTHLGFASRRANPSQRGCRRRRVCY